MPFDPHSDRPVVFKNNGAVVFWLFMALWMTMLVSCSKNFETPGAGVSASAIAVIVLGWVPSLALTAVALWAPKIRVEISPDGVLVREWAPLWVRKRQFAPKELSVSDVVKNEDSEGVSYSCSLLLPDKESIVLAHGSSQEVERMRIDLISALMTAEQRAGSKA
jgi:hypothetical protein